MGVYGGLIGVEENVVDGWIFMVVGGNKPLAKRENILPSEK